jgi:hypothetical protein
MSTEEYVYKISNILWISTMCITFGITLLVKYTYKNSFGYCVRFRRQMKIWRGTELNPIDVTGPDELVFRRMKPKNAKSV